MRGSEFAELRAFAAVARCRSFARGAEHLHVAPSTLSQTVRALEERLGVALLTRTTRKVSLTGAGERLLARFTPAVEEMEAAVLEAHDGRIRPSGVVRLYAPGPAYEQCVEPGLGRLRRALPDVTLDLTIDDAPVDAPASPYDLVIRRAEFVDTGMVARDLGTDLRHAVVASPSYLAEQGAPSSPEQLREHGCILWRPAGSPIQRWRFETGGEAVTIAVTGPLIVSHCGTAVAAALQGVGVAYVLESYALPFTAQGALTSLLAEHLPPLGGWRLCHPRRTRLAAAAAAVADLLTEPVSSVTPG